MKKFIIILGFLLVTSCAVSEGIAYEPTTCRYDAECSITGIHDHVSFTW